MSEFARIKGFLITLSIFTLCSQTVGCIPDFSEDSGEYHHHRDWFHPSRGFGPPHRRFGPPHGRFGPPPGRFGSYGPPSHGWHRPYSNYGSNYGYGYNKPKRTWNEYSDYDNNFGRRGQDDYWVFPDTDDRFPPRDQFPPSTTSSSSIPPEPVTQPPFTRPPFTPPPVTQPPFTRPPFTPPPVTSGTATTISPEIQNCIRSCPVTSEFNPVCGSNNITYSNPSRLQCAQFCGVDVEVRRSFPCSMATTPSPATSATTNPITQPDAPIVSPLPDTTTEYDFDLNERFQDKQK